MQRSKCPIPACPNCELHKTPRCANVRLTAFLAPASVIILMFGNEGDHLFLCQKHMPASEMANSPSGLWWGSSSDKVNDNNVPEDMLKWVISINLIRWELMFFHQQLLGLVEIATDRSLTLGGSVSPCVWTPPSWSGSRTPRSCTAPSCRSTWWACSRPASHSSGAPDWF